MFASPVRKSALLDAFDMQLVRALQLDPRAAFSHIATELGVSEQTISRRYRRLQRDGLLRVIGVVDPRALGQTDWMVRVRCRPDGSPAVADAIARREDVSWVSINSGGSDVTFALRARTREDRDDLLVQRLPRSAPVLDVAASVILHRFVNAVHRGPPQDAATAEQVSRVTATPRTAPAGEARLRDTDHVLLDLLARDGRASYTLLAQATRMSVGRVMRRLSALQEGGVVYFDVDIAIAALGYPTNALLWLKVAPAHLDPVGRTMAEHDEVPFAAAISGPFNLVAAVTCADLDQLYSYVTTKVGALDGIHDFELSPALRWVKQAGAMIADDHLVALPPAAAPRR